MKRNLTTATNAQVLRATRRFLTTRATGDLMRLLVRQLNNMADERARLGAAEDDPLIGNMRFFARGIERLI